MRDDTTDPQAERGEAPRTPGTAELSPAAVAGSYDPATATARDGSEASIDPDVLDVDGATRLLRLGRNTVYSLVARNEIPHRRVGKQIRFNRAAIMRWLDSWSSQGAKERR